MESYAGTALFCSAFLRHPRSAAPGPHRDLPLQICHRGPCYTSPYKSPCCDDLGPTTLIKLIILLTKNEVSRSMLSKVRASQAYRQTGQTDAIERIYACKYYQAAFAGADYFACLPEFNGYHSSDMCNWHRCTLLTRCMQSISLYIKYR